MHLDFKSSVREVSTDRGANQTKPTRSSAWMKFDPYFELDAKAVMLDDGYKERGPYEWPDQVRKNQQ